MRTAPSENDLAFPPRRVTAAVHPAHALGALLVARLLLPTLVLDDTLVMTALVMATSLRLRRLSLLLLAFLDQEFISEHLSDDLSGLGFGLLLKLAHGWPPGRENDAGAPMFPPQASTLGLQTLPLIATLEAGSPQCNNPVAEQN
jgi:hypothetical protein